MERRLQIRPNLLVCNGFGGLRLLRATVRVWPRCPAATLGHFATAEEAALHFARTPEGQTAASAALALPPLMTAAEAVAQAEVEGLMLEWDT